MSRKGSTSVLVAAAVAGRSLAEIAGVAGVSVSTVQRRLRDPSIVDEVRRARSIQRDETLGCFVAARAAALVRLATLVEDGDPAVALRAITILMATSMKFELVHDLNQRVGQLESAAIPILNDDAAIQVGGGR